jgi:hypothetical protein
MKEKAIQSSQSHDVAHSISLMPFVSPLFKWRILDIKSLLKEVDHKKSYNYFCKKLKKFEQAQLIGSFIHPANSKKYIYLTEKTFKYLSSDDVSALINKPEIIHDLIVSELARLFLPLSKISHVELEHEFNSKNKINQFRHIIPDGVIYTKDGKKIAFEVELTRKSEDRIIEKAKTYLGNEYDFIIYYFDQINLMNTYQKIFDQHKLANWDKKFYLLYNQSSTIEVDPHNIFYRYRGQERSVSELLKSYNSS